MSSTYAAGTTITLQKDSNDTAAYYYIDLVDAEAVAPAYTEPSGYLSITSYGATANDGTDDTTAINNCISAAQSQGKGVWIPSGTFNCNTAMITVPSGITIRGAGMWYSILSGQYAGFNINGNDQFYDFALFGNETTRNDSSGTTGIQGNGTNSVVQNIWFEHLKCGMWFESSTNGVYVEGCRVRDLYADGMNANNGTVNSMFENDEFRYTGDDSLALWSTGSLDQNDTIRFNTVQLPWLASAIAVYGGANNTVTDNMCYDTIAFSSGINISSAYSPVGFSGTLNVARNTLTRCGGYEWNQLIPYGAIWVDIAANITSPTITVNNNEIDSSTYSGICFEGPDSISSGCITFNSDNINGCGTYGIQVLSNAYGAATFNSVTVSNAASGGSINQAGSNFTITKGSGNSGW